MTTLIVIACIIGWILCSFFTAWCMGLVFPGDTHIDSFAYLLTWPIVLMGVIMAYIISIIPTSIATSYEKMTDYGANMRRKTKDTDE